MEPISCTFEGRGLPFTDGIEFHMDGLVRSRNLVKGWDVFEGMGFMEHGLPEMKRKSVLGIQLLENSIDDANGDSGKSSKEFVTRFSSSAIKTNDDKLQRTGVKFENLASQRESKDNPICVENSVLSSQEPSVSAKRARIANVQSQNAVCLVFGCNKDLSSSKEYHRRHKVCDIHSKTAVVIVNGIQQRFCQQCSRFHVIAEFDEGRRSCRKRLAGHNKRRRKPQLDTHFDSTFLVTDLHEMGKHYPSKNCLNSPLSVLELYAASNSSIALSLLSAQSHYSSSNSSAGIIPMDHPPILFNRHSNLAFNWNSTKASTPKNLAPSVFSSSSGEVDGRIPDPQNEFSQESETLPEGFNTVDLLQLSLHLQRVEQQKHSAQLKPEDDMKFC